MMTAIQEVADDYPSAVPLLPHEKMPQSTGAVADAFGQMMTPDPRRVAKKDGVWKRADPTALMKAVDPEALVLRVKTLATGRHPSAKRQERQ